MFSEIKYFSTSKQTISVVPLLTLLFSFALSGTTLAMQTVTLTTKLWPPYHYYDETSGELTGKSVEALKCSFKKIETPLEIQVMPWARAQLLVQNNIADGFFSASWNAKRDEYAVRSDNIAPQNWAWYSLKSSKITPDHSNFKNTAKVGSTIGSNIYNWLEKEGYDVSNQITSDHMIKMLLAGRVDAIMGNELVIDSLLESRNQETTLNKHIARSMPVGVYFSKTFLADKPGFLEKLNKAIVSCRN